MKTNEEKKLTPRPRYTRIPRFACFQFYEPLGKLPSIKELASFNISYWCCKCPLDEDTKEKMKPYEAHNP